MQSLCQTAGLLQQVQLAVTCQRAQGQRPDHAVFTLGHETSACGSDDQPAGTNSSWYGYVFLFCLHSAVLIFGCALTASSILSTSS